MTTPSDINQPADEKYVEEIIQQELKNKYDNRSTIKDMIFDKDCLLFTGYKIIRGINFRNCVFMNGIFRNVNMMNISFINCDLDNSDFCGSTLGNVLFDHCDTSHSTFQGSLTLDQVKFTYTHGVGVNMRDCSHVNRMIIVNSNFSDTNFSGCRFVESFFENSDLSRCIFNGVEFVGSSFIRSNMREVDLSGSNGLLDPIDYLFDEFEWDNQDIIVYVAFDDDQDNNINWYIETHGIDKKSILKSEVNYDRSDPNGCGIQVGNKKYIRSKLSNMKGDYGYIWKGKILLEWLPGVVVSYFPMCHKIRTSRLILMEQLDYTYFSM